MPPDFPSLLLLVLACVLAGGLLTYYFVRPAGGELTLRGLAIRLACSARQLLRRWSWFVLVVGGLLLYPVQQYYLIEWQARQVPGSDTVQAAALAAAKVVDVLQVYSKFSIAVGAFCLLNFLAWAALNATVDVLPDWAKGYYKQKRGDYPQQVGFKGTFLRLSHEGRIAVYLAGWGLQLAAAGLSVWAAFQIQ